jgi:hypothetical protein
MNKQDLLSTNFIGIFSHIFEMSILFSPPAIIFINSDLVQQIQDVFTRQLYLTEIISKATLDSRVIADGYYNNTVHIDGYRIMVMMDLSDQNNRAVADIVLFAKSGMVSVLSNKYGVPGVTLPIDRVYLTALINLQMVPPNPVDQRPDMDDGFVGETDNDNFNPLQMDPPTNIEPSVL